MDNATIVRCTPRAAHRPATRRSASSGRGGHSDAAHIPSSGLRPSSPTGSANPNVGRKRATAECSGGSHVATASTSECPPRPANGPTAWATAIRPQPWPTARDAAVRLRHAQAADTHARHSAHAVATAKAPPANSRDAQPPQADALPARSPLIPRPRPPRPPRRPRDRKRISDPRVDRI